MNKSINSIIASLVFAVIGLASFLYENYFISHVSYLLLGLVFGAVVQKRNMVLERWARKKIKVGVKV